VLSSYGVHYGSTEFNLDSELVQPSHVADALRGHAHRHQHVQRVAVAQGAALVEPVVHAIHRGVAVQVEFEIEILTFIGQTKGLYKVKVSLKANFETRRSLYSCIGSRVEARRFRALWVNCIGLVQPHRGPEPRHDEDQGVGAEAAEQALQRVCHVHLRAARVSAAPAATFSSSSSFSSSAAASSCLDLGCKDHLTAAAAAAAVCS
jgi:hypothetical protein